MDASQTRSLLLHDEADWYRLRSLLLRLSEWKMGHDPLYISAGDLADAGEYAARLNDIDCTYTLAEVKEMGWLPPGNVHAIREALGA